MTAFILGLFIGCGLGVAVMSMMIVSKGDCDEQPAD